jgi:hypothetical protein
LLFVTEARRESTPFPLGFPQERNPSQARILLFFFAERKTGRKERLGEVYPPEADPPRCFHMEAGAHPVVIRAGLFPETPYLLFQGFITSLIFYARFKDAIRIHLCHQEGFHRTFLSVRHESGTVPSSVLNVFFLWIRH